MAKKYKINLLRISRVSIYHEEQYAAFKKWLDLDIRALTWNGQYEAEFNDFWNVVFLDGLSVVQLCERLRYLIDTSDIGPLSSWFKWLHDHFIVYTFMSFGHSIRTLSEESAMSAAELAMILRNYFSDRYPLFNERWDSFFQVAHNMSPAAELSFSAITSVVDLPPETTRGTESLMPSIEITLYKDWKGFQKKMKKDLLHAGSDFTRVSPDRLMKSHYRFLKDLTLLTIIGSIVIYATVYLNQIYEKHLVNKITIYEPQFLWLDKSLKFKSETKQPITVAVNKFDDIDKFKQIESRQTERDVESASTFGTETELTVTSFGALPKDFDVTDLEQSRYEGNKNSGYRDVLFGSKKVYRVMMNTYTPDKIRDELGKFIEEYKVTQVDKVKPGMDVPGGIYYNVYVPKENLKNFLTKVMATDESILYESRTQIPVPAGMSKVFIWVKQL